MSHPSRVRGLKSMYEHHGRKFQQVAPFTGAWIEIVVQRNAERVTAEVAPFTGAWIEILIYLLQLPMAIVAPFTGAWIEITLSKYQ